MTDPELTRRAEQALLGALITRPESIAHISGLRARDFAEPVHQAIFAAITGQAPSRGAAVTAWAGRLRGLLARLFRRNEHEAAAYLGTLPAQCPEPAHLPSYASMVAKLSQQRAAQGHAEPAVQEDTVLDSAATWLDNAVRDRGSSPRRRQATTPGTLASPGDSLSAATARMARALRPAITAQAAERHVAPRHDAPQARSLSHEDLQDQVLADMARRPADALAVVGWLPAEAFTAGPRRDLYDLIAARLAAGRPVDPLIIAWEAALQHTPGAAVAADEQSVPALANHLGTLNPPPGAASVLGRALLADHVCTTRLGPDWITATQLTPPPVTPAQPDHHPAPVPEATLAPEPVPVADIMPFVDNAPDPDPAPAPDSVPGADAVPATEARPAQDTPAPGQRPKPPAPRPAAPIPADRRPAMPAAHGPVARM